MKAFLRNAALLAGSAAFALALGEGALRLIGFSYPNFWQPDELTGSALRPGMHGWQREEGRAYVQINSRGLRDRERDPAKPGEVYRIAVLGDSYAEAMQVDLDDTFWSRLPEELERCGFQGGRRVETINFGVSGYGTAHELLTLRHRVWEYSPDMVLVAFFPGNDVRNNSRSLEAAKGRAYFVVKDGRLELDESFRSDPEWLEKKRISARRALLQELRVYQLLRRVRAGDIAAHFHNAPIAAGLAARDPARALSEPGLDENVFRAPIDAQWREAWDITERLLVAMHDDTRARGADFLLAVLSTPGTVYPDPELRKRYAAALGVPSLLYPESRLLGLGERNGFDVLPLAPQMQRRADAARVYFHGFEGGTPGFGHWNQAGHRAAAELMARHLCQTRNAKPHVPLPAQ